MSKYIIEIPDDTRRIWIDVFGEGYCYTQTKSVDDLEVLNSDYINEHYGELQDEAYKKGYADAERIWRAPSSDNEFYQKGFEDGKNSIENGCKGCKYEDQHGYDEPCNKCLHAHANHYTPMPKQDDRIEVGDEVEWTSDKYVVTYLNYNIETSEITDYDLLAYDGSVVDHVKKCAFTKTGRHFDIVSILEAMRTND